MRKDQHESYRGLFEGNVGSLVRSGVKKCKISVDMIGTLATIHAEGMSQALA
jgi:hypothetical protein